MCLDVPGGGLCIRGSDPRGAACRGADWLHFGPGGRKGHVPFGRPLQNSLPPHIFSDLMQAREGGGSTLTLSLAFIPKRKGGAPDWAQALVHRVPGRHQGLPTASD